MLDKVGSIEEVDRIKKNCELVSLLVPIYNFSPDELYNSPNYPSTFEILLLSKFPIDDPKTEMDDTKSKRTYVKMTGLKNRIQPSTRFLHKLYDPIPLPPINNEIIVNVLMFHPVVKSTPLRQQSFYVEQEIVVLGSQTLAQLKDVIQCSFGDYGLGDCSEMIHDLENTVKFKELYSSSMFYLGNNFYDDLQEDNSHRLSDTYIGWLRDNPELFPEASHFPLDMKSTKIGDLVLQLGRNYLYLHIGKCEHPIVFSDVRLTHRYVTPDVNRYPILIGHMMRHSMFCCVCKQLLFKWLVYDAGPILPLDPAPVCHPCLIAGLYTATGEKIHPDFKIKTLSDQLRTGLTEKELDLCLQALNDGCDPVALALAMSNLRVFGGERPSLDRQVPAKVERHRILSLQSRQNTPTEHAIRA
ncbi:small nuclear RNA activating complex, polypeptide 3 [Cichlidogyrus casuarinus]|uniref:snRNA-activating protein complex subunit 3 n=1 Tax=Cichlidogyrus casuarinus TaxID=1844966 RepID=A0ABD2Q811_9PLAT